LTFCMMQFSLILFFFLGRSLWYRPFHTIYVQNPEETPEDYRRMIEEQLDWQIERMNVAFEFHEFDFRFVKGDIYVKSSDYWDESGYKCGDVRKNFCTPWSNELGRQDENTVEIWLCIMGDNIGCAGVGGGNTAACQSGPFFNRNKIVVMHEVGHCLGCGDKTKFCQPGFDEFAKVTGKLYKTVMGGGSKCDHNLGLEKSKIPFYEDATKQYCEDGVCLTLSPPEHECTSTIKSKFAGIVKKLKPYCGSDLATGINAVNFKFCIVQETSRCVESTTFGQDEDFVPTSKHDCAELIEQDESLCPSKTFYWSKKKQCHCCSFPSTDPRFETTNAKYDLYQLDITPIFNEDESVHRFVQSYSIPMENSPRAYFLVLVIIGIFAILISNVVNMCKQAKNYAHIPEPQVAEI